MKFQEFQDLNLKENQKVNVFCNFNGISQSFAIGIISKIRIKKYKRYHERLNEKNYYKLIIKYDTPDWEHGVVEADIDSYLIEEVKILN